MKQWLKKKLIDELIFKKKHIKYSLGYIYISNLQLLYLPKLHHAYV